MKIRTTSGALGLTAGLLVALAAALLLVGSAAAAGNETLTNNCSMTSANPGQTFTCTISQNADVVTTGNQITVNFDQTRLHVTDVVLGPDWTAGQFIIGVAPNNTKPLAIADANATGSLKNVAGYYSPGSGSVATGARTFIVVTFQAQANGGSSSITLSNAVGIDSAGAGLNETMGGAQDVFVTGPISVGGFVETVVPSSGSGISLITILLIAVAAVVVAGGLGFGARNVARRMRTN